jgi:beta-lactam-binding protein with PASTA domain
MVFLLLALVFTAAVAVAVILATSTSNSVVHFRNVVGHDANSAINSLRGLINSNTK